MSAREWREAKHGVSRRLWRAVTAALRTRPVVDWNLVEREKAKLEVRGQFDLIGFGRAAPDAACV